MVAFVSLPKHLKSLKCQLETTHWEGNARHWKGKTARAKFDYKRACNHLIPTVFGLK